MQEACHSSRQTTRREARGTTRDVDGSRASPPARNGDIDRSSRSTSKPYEAARLLDGFDAESGTKPCLSLDVRMGMVGPPSSMLLCRARQRPNKLGDLIEGHRELRTAAERQVGAQRIVLARAAV